MADVGSGGKRRTETSRISHRAMFKHNLDPNDIFSRRTRYLDNDNETRRAPSPYFRLTTIATASRPILSHDNHGLHNLS
jgi:hypothetical protein